MKFKIWFENMSYSNKPILSYISPALSKRIELLFLPKWQNNQEFLSRLKYVIDNDGDEFIQYKPQEFEKTVIKIAQKIAHEEFQSRIKKEKEDNPNLETQVGDYELCWSDVDTFERIVCGKNVNFEKTGMPAYDISGILKDPELKGYYGVHTGNANAWLDWLNDDGYCDGDIHIYSISIPDEPPFYKTEDKNSGGFAGEYADKQVPSGEIIFSKLKVIPAVNIKLKKFIKEKDYLNDRKQRGY